MNIGSPSTISSRGKAYCIAIALTASLLMPSPAAAEVGDAMSATGVHSVETAVASRSETTGLLTFAAEQEILGSPGSDTYLGGARIDRSEHAEAFAGMWAQGGELAAWSAGPSEAPARQFEPRANLIEDVYFENSTTRDGPFPSPGDRVGAAMGVVPMDAPVAWEAERGESGGSLDWDSSVAVQNSTSSFGGNRQSTDGIMLRVDALAVGGDVDARSEPIELPPLVIDLPRAYPATASFAGLIGTATPYVSYFNTFDVVFRPEQGRIVIRASVQGYIPEAHTQALPNGAFVKHWHLPLTGVIAVDLGEGEGEGEPRAGMGLPGGGVAQLLGVTEPERAMVAPGQMFVAGADAEPARTSDDAPDPSTAEAGEELVAAAAIDYGLDQPVRLRLDTAEFEATIDPDLRGEGLLGLVDPRSTRLGRTYARNWTIPAVELAGETVLLNRSRLIGLRALPFRDGGGIRTMLTVRREDDNLVVSRGSRFYRAGLLVDAVYDLGSGVYAFVEYQFFHEGVWPGGRINTAVEIRSLSGASVAARPYGYGELIETGAALHGTATHTHEFSGTGSRDLAVGDHLANARYRVGGRLVGGNLRVLRAPTAVTGREPDPDTSIVERPVALAFAPPADPEPAAASLDTFWVGLGTETDPGPPAPPPLGEPCVDPQIVDGFAPDAPPTQDVTEAWIEADPVNLYASIRLRSVPESALSPTGDRYSLHWRNDHQGYFARATVDASGEWRFQVGFTGTSLTLDVPGEVEAGPDGVIRMAIPRFVFGVNDGLLLRDLGAHAFVGSTSVRADSAPSGSSVEYGLGGDFRVAPCEPPEPLATNLSFDPDPPEPVRPGAEATLQVRLSTDEGAAVHGEEVTFELWDGTTRTAVTNGGGIAGVVVEAPDAPGSYDVDATYPGRAGAFETASTSATLVVERVATKLTLAVEGRGANRVLEALLTEVDPPSDAVGSRTIDFFGDGELIGSGTTNENGIATLQAPPRYRGGNHTFEARFEGDDSYLPSAGRAEP